MKQYILGYDCRYRVDALRDRGIVAAYGMVDVPVSVDEMLWASIFWRPTAYPKLEYLPGPEILNRISVDTYIGANDSLWEDYSRMEDWLSWNNADMPELVSICVTWCTKNANLEWREGGPYRTITLPFIDVQPFWRLLGYEVADGSRCSAMTTPNFAPDIRAFIDRYSIDLNVNGLFDTLEHATKYRNHANRM